MAAKEAPPLSLLLSKICFSSKEEKSKELILLKNIRYLTFLVENQILMTICDQEVMGFCINVR